ncbi:MAG TPA: hypothetical protein VNK48_16165 [Xanthobacteraceae bacterium]|nr:hypothetical protein [Xanthobacteraceae bacterium]
MIFRSSLVIGALLAVALPAAAHANGKRAAPARPCGTSIEDWCPSYRGDPCNRHKTTAECKADPKCYGILYRGVSFVPCFWDERGFASNCPTVGCTSRRPPRGAVRKPFVCPTC